MKGITVGTRYRYTTELPLGDMTSFGRAAAEVQVSYSVDWGSPETGAGYMADPYLYDPGAPDEIEELTLDLVDGKPGPFDQEAEAMVLQDIAQNHKEAMLEEARQTEAAWAE